MVSENERAPDRKRTLAQANGMTGAVSFTETTKGSGTHDGTVTQLWLPDSKNAWVITATGGATTCMYAGSTWALQPSHNPCFGTSTKQAWNQTTPACVNGTGCELQQTTADSLTSVLGNFSGGMCTPRTRSVCFPPTAGSNGANGTAAQFTTTTFGAMQTGAALPANAFAVPAQCVLPPPPPPPPPVCDVADGATLPATTGCCAYQANKTFIGSWTQSTYSNSVSQTFKLLLVRACHAVREGRGWGQVALPWRWPRCMFSAQARRTAVGICPLSLPVPVWAYLA